MNSASSPLTTASAAVEDTPTRSTDSLFDSAWGKFKDQVGTIISATVVDAPTWIADSLLDSAWEKFTDLVSQHKSEDVSKPQRESMGAQYESELERKPVDTSKDKYESINAAKDDNGAQRKSTEKQQRIQQQEKLVYACTPVQNPSPEVGMHFWDLGTVQYESGDWGDTYKLGLRRGRRARARHPGSD